MACKRSGGWLWCQQLASNRASCSLAKHHHAFGVGAGYLRGHGREGGSAPGLRAGAKSSHGRSRWFEPNHAHRRQPGNQQDRRQRHDEVPPQQALHAAPLTGPRASPRPHWLEVSASRSTHESICSAADRRRRREAALAVLPRPCQGWAWLGSNQRLLPCEIKNGWSDTPGLSGFAQVNQWIRLSAAPRS